MDGGEQRLEAVSFWLFSRAAEDQLTPSDSKKLAKWISLSRSSDDRGTLTPLDFEALPFVPARAFFVTDVPVGAQRGGHAHRYDEQVLVCVSGRVEVELQFGKHREVVVCEPDGRALVVERRVWFKQTYREPGTSLLVLSSQPYDPDSYIKDNDIVREANERA